CDTLDNDCDGRVDEPFQIGGACTVGSGACANPNGVWVCDNSMTGNHRCNGSPKPAGTETCNGLDDDCDGKVDELDTTSNRTSDDKLIYLAGPNVTKEEAEAACEKIASGWRLCTAAEWLDACNSSGNTTFPYGATYTAQ